MSSHNNKKGNNHESDRDSSDYYATLRTALHDDAAGGVIDARVEVNQRALIDKILARYASAGAVYRELLQNSNDAGATEAELRFTLGDDDGDGDKQNNVTQVVYRNNGQPFRPQDWNRLRKIAEGNPDPTKVGAFGVGAYTMFSICEEPMVISGKQCLMFFWKGDSLWTKTANRNDTKNNNNTKDDDPWTTFCLPSRDAYPLPDLAELGEFLAASLTFTTALQSICVHVNDRERLSIHKNTLTPPRPVTMPKNDNNNGGGWWRSEKAVVAKTASPSGLFSLRSTGKDAAGMEESVVRVTVRLDRHEAVTTARFITATAHTHLGRSLIQRMERVTKKQPPKTVRISLFLNYDLHDDTDTHHKKKNPARRVTRSLAPPAGAGRIFIGFRTSQTTGLAAHVAAPFVPTVEREAMDLQDTALRTFNLELLQMAGILLRLTLDHAFTLLDEAWQASAEERARLETQAMERHRQETSRSNNNNSNNNSANVSDDDDDTTVMDDDDESTVTTASKSGFFGFARFMARGVKKRIVSVVSSVNELLDDGSDLLRPPDPRELVTVEEQAIALMQAYCPHRSTPDPQVGTALAEGFGRCLAVPPPVLTVTGVVRSDWARLPHQGLQAFCPERVIRQIVYDNATEYHDHIAQCRKLQMDDLLEYVAQNVLSEDQAVKLLRWWRPFYRTSTTAVRNKGPRLKELLRFHPDGQPDVTVAMRDWLFYVEKDSLLWQSTDQPLPLPETVIPTAYEDKIGAQTLTDSCMKDWFEPLPMEIWAEFVAYQPCMVAGRAEDEALRIQVLVTLYKEYSRRPLTERNVFGSFCQSLLADKPCLPFDSPEPSTKAADIPSDLYLYSAELKAFEGVGSFRKVAASLKDAGITEDFLLALGVRKSVSIDFLFSNLDTLQWSNDPRPLVEYLRQATLTNEDLKKLLQTRYLPAENDTKTYAPSELFLPTVELRIFPFVKMLQWPTESELSERSENGAFLVRLGMQTIPKLSQILEYLTDAKIDDAQRRKCLEYVSARLSPKGVYHKVYSNLGFSQLKRYKFLPCSTHEPMSNKPDRKELLSPVQCYSENACGVMGLSVVDPDLGDSGKLYGSLFQCAPEPESRVLVRQLLQLVETAKKLQNKANEPDEHVEMADRIETSFTAIFNYLSHRSSDFDLSELTTLQAQAFIPCRVNKNSIVCIKPNSVFFRQDQGRRDTLTEELFQLVDFSPFLSAVGVKQEATTRELFQLLLDSPKAVLQSLGSEKKYRSLLRRIAAQPPFGSVTQTIKKSPFLLAYSAAEKDDEGIKSGHALTYDLAAAEDVYIIDNSFFGRMFPVKRAPHESDLEDFYALLGSRYISKSVERRFEHVGKAMENTPLTNALRERIMERTPLLLSPHVTTRPMVDDAVALLESKNLDFFQASKLMAVYSLRGITRRTQTTCFSRKVGKVSFNRNAIYVVDSFDWFDVGYAIGDLILKRCQLEDAFFISSLLDAPLEQLRSRGFPVDRILQPVVEPEPVPEPVPEPAVAPAPTMANIPPKGTSSANPSSPSTPAAQKAAAGTPAANPDAPASTPDVGKQPEKKSETQENGMEEILTQMFPDADKDFIRGALGNDPSLDDVRNLAETMAQHGYPASNDDKSKADEDDAASTATASTTATSPPGSKEKKKKGFRSKLGKAFGGLRGSAFGGATTPSPPKPPPLAGAAGAAGSSGGAGGAFGPSQNTRHEVSGPASPAQDASSQASLERMLQQKVAQAANVGSNEVNSPETLSTSVPADLDRGDTCEVIDGQNLRPFTEYRNGVTAGGIRIFASKREPASVDFLAQHSGAVEAFGAVLTQLAHVYDLPLASIAIFHEPGGNTIAFNRGRSVFYNLRFFYALHYRNGQQPPAADCYSYWYITTAHELSHNLVSAHNKEHGFYTENYASLYLPKLAVLMASLPQS